MTITAIINFFNHPFFIVFGGLTATLVILGFVYQIICWVFGITPVIFRLGIALWKRRVAIFGSTEVFESLSASLIGSNIFRKKNIIHITPDNVDKAKNETIFLVDWETFSNKIEQVFSARINQICSAPPSLPNSIWPLWSGRISPKKPVRTSIST